MKLDRKPMDRIVSLYQRDILTLLRKFLPSPNPSDFLSNITKVITNEEFLTATRRIAVAMATRSLRANRLAWKQAAAQSGSRQIFAAIQRELRGHVGMEVERIVIDNARLIRSLPLTLAQHVTRFVAKQQQSGTRAEDIAKALRHAVPRLSKSRAQLISRTEVSKAESALTRARAEDIGIRYYVWATSKDQRVRKSHRKMDGVIVSFNDPPSPEELVGERPVGHYHAGEIWNCRCLELPLASVNEIGWPHKYYHAGRVQVVSRRQFENIAGLQKAA